MVHPPSLFSLARELREAIYEHLYNICQSSDTAPAVFPSDVSRITVEIYPYGNISYPSAYPKYSLLPILQTNRQLRTEFRQHIDFQKAQGNGIKYQLEVWSEKLNVRLTWKVLPLPPQDPFLQVQTLDVGYRIADRGASRRVYHTNFGHPDKDSEAGMMFFRIFSNIFFHGPQGYYDPILNATHKPGQFTLYNRCRIHLEKLNVRLEFNDQPYELDSISGTGRHFSTRFENPQTSMQDIFSKIDISKMFDRWLLTMYRNFGSIQDDAPEMELSVIGFTSNVGIHITGPEQIDEFEMRILPIFLNEAQSFKVREEADRKRLCHCCASYGTTNYNYTAVKDDIGHLHDTAVNSFLR